MFKVTGEYKTIKDKCAILGILNLTASFECFVDNCFIFEVEDVVAEKKYCFSIAHVDGCVTILKEMLVSDLLDLEGIGYFEFCVGNLQFDMSYKVIERIDYRVGDLQQDN